MRRHALPTVTAWDFEDSGVKPRFGIRLKKALSFDSANTLVDGESAYQRLVLSAEGGTAL